MNIKRRLHFNSPLGPKMSKASPGSGLIQLRRLHYLIMTPAYTFNKSFTNFNFTIENYIFKKQNLPKLQLY